MNILTIHAPGNNDHSDDFGELLIKVNLPRRREGIYLAHARVVRVDQ